MHYIYLFAGKDKHNFVDSKTYDAFFFKSTNRKASFPHVVTVIRTLSVDDAAGKVIYDLQGRRVQNMDKKGIYIVNGRKVVIK